MPSDIFFHRFVVTDQVFYLLKHTFALVNLRPIVPGHVLVVLRRIVPRLNMLTIEESTDYFLTVQKVAKMIQEQYKADALNIAIQDGVYAGQSVPHLHTHIIPRYKANNMGDAIYEKIEEFDDDLKRTALLRELEKLDGRRVDEWKEATVERKNRLMEDMKQEADLLRKLIELITWP